MKIAILGSGVIGVTSAWYLARAGHDVTVIDRQPGPALETSFANAGQVSPGYASPWAAPGVPQKAARWLMMKHAPLILHPKADPAMLRWLWQMLTNCTSDRYAVNKARMVRLAEYSRDQLIALRAETGISYDGRARGTLQVFRTQKQLDDVAKDVAVLEASGVPFELMDRAGCIATEPGLAGSGDKIVGGLRLPHDETGDCFKFTNALAEMAKALGVTFVNDTSISGIAVDQGKVTGIQTSRGLIEADKYLLSLGSYAAPMARALDIDLPVYPVKGYSITAPVINADKAPVSTLLDESYKIAITRLGDRIRVGGMAEISGYNHALPARCRETLAYCVEDLFPGAGNVSEATYWSGLRPMTPDGTPVIGGTKYPNLYLNTGHGTLGWTMSCGSGKVIADIMSGTTPDIETSDLSIARYGNR